MTTPATERFIDYGGQPRPAWEVTEYEPDTAGYEPLGILEAGDAGQAHQAACERWPHIPPERIRVGRMTAGPPQRP